MELLEQFDYERLNDETNEWEYRHSRISINLRAAIDIIGSEDCYAGERDLWRVKAIREFKRFKMFK